MITDTEPLVWFELHCFTDDGSEDTKPEAVIDLDESQVGFHPEGTARHPGERAITINLSGAQMAEAKGVPSLVQRTIAKSEPQDAAREPSAEAMAAVTRGGVCDGNPCRSTSACTCKKYARIADAFAAQAVAAERKRIFPPPHPRPEFAPPEEVAAERAKPAASDLERAEWEIDSAEGERLDEIAGWEHLIHPKIRERLLVRFAAALAESRRPLEDALREIAGDWTGNKKRRDIARRALGDTL